MDEPGLTTPPPPSPASSDGDADDASLVRRCRDGDAKAWRVLVERYQRLVHAIVRRTGLDEHGAADVFQTVFARLLQALPSIDQPDRVRAWIVTTAKREALRLRQRAQRTVSLTPEPGPDGDEGPAFDLPDDGPLPDAQLESLQLSHRLRLALDRLDGRCHRLLTLLFADDEERLPYDQIASRLAMPAGSIGPTRARCLGKLRLLMEGA
jgi:RNA polymerase sigma factor (sigma-70 family)